METSRVRRKQGLEMEVFELRVSSHSYYIVSKYKEH